MNHLAFDIETIPNTDFGRQVYGLPDSLSDGDVAKIMFFKQRQARGTEFLPLIQHRVVAISVALRRRDSFNVWSLGGPDAEESDLVARFFAGLEKYQPDLVSWNGSGFDLPVLHYRALHYGLDASAYWEVGEHDREFRFNNYLGRFHWRHVDLMDVLAGYQMGGRASLDQASISIGLPGKIGIGGANVWDAYQEGKRAEISDYCEIDVLNTYLLFLRFEKMRGTLDAERYASELSTVRRWLQASDGEHFQTYHAAWSDGPD